MSWTAWRVTFRLLSPVHAGWRKIGNLQQTRPYVTGRMLWGALTARLVRDEGGNAYRAAGQKVDETLTFTYFYPSTDPDQVRVWPWENTWDEFAWMYLGSYTGTALRDGHAAEEGTLHETECLAPCTRQGEPVFLLGYLFEQQNSELKWKAALPRLQVGGERGYGWGRMTLHHEPRRVEDGWCFGLRWDHESNLLRVPKGRSLLAHTVVGDGVECAGTIEPLLGRETVSTSGGFGESCSSPAICWVPGSIIQEEMRIQIGPRGIWTPLKAGMSRVNA